MTGQSCLCVLVCDCIHLCVCICPPCTSVCLSGACMQCVLGCLCIHDVSLQENCLLPQGLCGGFYHANFLATPFLLLFTHPLSTYSFFEQCPVSHSHSCTHSHLSFLVLLWASEQLLVPMRITPHHAKPLLTSYGHSDKCNKSAGRRLAPDCMCVLCMCDINHWASVVCQI